MTPWPRITEQLVIRPMSPDDAPFVLELVNTEGWLRFIGDRGVRNVADATRYLENGSIASHARHGFGGYHVARRSDLTPLGTCTLLQREHLTDVDLGFAFLPKFGGQGYALEAAAAVIEHARCDLCLPRLCGITQPENTKSIRLLEKLDFRFDRLVQLTPDNVVLQLYTRDLTPP